MYRGIFLSIFLYFLHPHDRLDMMRMWEHIDWSDITDTVEWE